MSATRVNEVVARPVRTVVQGTPAWIITEVIDSFVYDMNDQQFGVLVLFLAMVFSAAQTAYENYKGKGFLRSVPPTNVPVVDK